MTGKGYTLPYNTLLHDGPIDTNGMRIRANGYVSDDMVFLGSRRGLLGWWLPFSSEIATRLVTYRWVPFFTGARPEEATDVTVSPRVLKALTDTAALSAQF